LVRFPVTRQALSDSVDTPSPAGSEPSLAIRKVPEPAPVHFLVVDKDPPTGKGISSDSQIPGLTVTVVRSARDLGADDGLKDYDAIILDYEIESEQSFADMMWLRSRAPGTPIIMLTNAPLPVPPPIDDSQIIGFVHKTGGPDPIIKHIHEMFMSRYVAWVMST